MICDNKLLGYYLGKRVLVTGHTGFKGTWLTRILLDSGAIVCGYSLDPPTSPNLYEFADFDKFAEQYTSVIADIRNLERMKAVFHNFQPQE